MWCIANHGVNKSDQLLLTPLTRRSLEHLRIGLTPLGGANRIQIATQQISLPRHQHQGGRGKIEPFGSTLQRLVRKVCLAGKTFGFASEAVHA